MPKPCIVEGIASIAPADIEAADELGYRVKLLGRGAADRAGHRAARASGHGAEGSAIAQVMGVTNAVVDRRRRRGADHARRPRRWRRATASAVVADLVDIARGRAGRPVRPADRRARDKPSKLADAAPRRRLLYPSARARPAGHLRRHREAPRRRADLARNRSCSVIAARGPMAAMIRRARRRRRHYPDHPCVPPRMRFARAEGDRQDEGVIAGRAATDSHRDE